VATDLSHALRAEVARRADHRCEYCRISEEHAGFPHQVDHIISRKHGGQSSAENLALACVICNRYKGSDLASISKAGELVRLFNPRQDQWADHFRIDGDRIQPISGVGSITVRLLRMNEPERLAERRLLQALGVYPLT
jgi:hypothetical protein